MKTVKVNNVEGSVAGRKCGQAFPRKQAGFTVVEVIVASSIMTILCIGILSVFSFVVKLNQGNNLRSQALTVLQAETELYRSYKFVPDQTVTATELQAVPIPQKTVTSSDGTTFHLDVGITNISFEPSPPAPSPSEATCTLKEITITATPVNPRPQWLENVQTTLTIQRVRRN